MPSLQPRRSLLHAGLLCAFTLLLPAAQPALAASAADQETLVIVVRHAEKAIDNPRDPTLSEAGAKRAEALAAHLHAADLAAVVTSEFKRTNLTGQPAAKAHGLNIEVRAVAGLDPAAYGQALKSWIEAHHKGRTVLVVGHSNTVPILVEKLSGTAVEAMADSEYDRYTVVHLPAKGPARIEVLRY